MELTAQVVLTPTESKRLLSKAVLNLPEVRRALDDGIVLIHPSSTTIFMLEELGFDLSAERIWVCGHISPKGLCISRPMIDTVLGTPGYTDDQYPYDIVIRKGELLPFKQPKLGGALEQITSKDVYIKSVNVLDMEGKAGILLAGRSTGGSMGVVLKAQKVKKFKIIIPVGLEKQVPIPLNSAMKAAVKATKAQGIPCGLWRIRGKVVTEIEAFRQLFDVEALPVSAGGICGAEGAIVWVLQGEEENVRKAYDLCDQIRGHEMPYHLNVYDCAECPFPPCDLAGKKPAPKGAPKL